MVFVDGHELDGIHLLRGYRRLREADYCRDNPAVLRLEVSSRNNLQWRVDNQNFLV
jgi:hypothetical protein